MIKEVKITADGSQTLYIPELDEHYHSHHGALQESLHVFIQMGLTKQLERHLDEINIFEVGYGTGLNALLTFFADDVEGKKIKYHSIEAFPLKEEWKELSYSELINHKDAEVVFEKMHEAQWGGYVSISNNFELKKEEITLQNFHSNQLYDLVYYDAFGPRVQPDLWTEELFQKVYSLMKEGGVLVTYCAKGQVRRDLQKVGFEVERLPGPPGKREMLRATKL